MNLELDIRPKSRQVGRGSKSRKFCGLNNTKTRDTDDAETLSVLLDVLLLLRVTKSNFALASKMLFSLASSDENDQVGLHRINRNWINRVVKKDSARMGVRLHPVLLRLKGGPQVR